MVIDLKEVRVSSSNLVPSNVQDSIVLYWYEEFYMRCKKLNKAVYICNLIIYIT